MFDHFGILGIKKLRAFLKNFYGICYFSLFKHLSLRQLACIYVYVQLFFYLPNHDLLSTRTLKHAKRASTRAPKTYKHVRAREHVKHAI